MLPGGATYPTDTLPLATLPRRFVGWMIDTMLFGIPFTFVVLLANMAHDAGTVADVPLWIAFGFSMASALYETVCVAMRGRTLGAWIMGVRIVRVDSGDLPTWSKAGIRALLPMALQAVPVFGLALDAVVYAAALFHPRKQGLHDRAAGTIVVVAPR